MNRHPRYPYPHNLPIHWSVEEYGHGAKWVTATCTTRSGTYGTQHQIPRFASSRLVALLVETLTMEILDALGTSNLQPVGLMDGVS